MRFRLKWFWNIVYDIFEGIGVTFRINSGLVAILFGAVMIIGFLFWLSLR